MFKDDRTRIQHMIDAAREAEEFIQGRERADLDEDRLLALGLLKCIEIIGEAAVYVSEDLRKQSPHVPWAKIVAMRNRLVHVYFEIDLDQVWKAVVEDVPLLVQELESILEQMK